MLAITILAEKLSRQCKRNDVTRENLTFCCKTLLENYNFDCVFVAFADSPEVPPAPLAYAGKVDIVDTCLYRLGVEDRVALTKLAQKSFPDITGKPIFNPSGSLR